MRVALFLFLLSSSIFSQSKIAKGVVLDELTNTPIPYVNLSILESQRGISSDEDGSYALEIEEGDLGKNVHLSSLGYQDSIIPVSKLIKINTIYLKPKVEELSEIFISNSHQQEFLTINELKTSRKYGLPSLTTQTPWILGLFFPFREEYARTINLNEVKIFLNNKSFFTPNAFPSRFRVRILSVGDDDLPKSDLIHEGIIVETQRKQKEVVIDISDYNLSFPKTGLFVAIEWLYIPFNKYIDTYRTQKEKNHKEIRYAPRIAYFKTEPGDFKTAGFAYGQWFDLKMYGMTYDEVRVPAIFLTLSD